MSTFYNTTKEPNKAELDKRAQTQEQRVLAWFMEHPESEATPYYIQLSVMQSSPITSVRRAMTNLTLEGKLLKTDKKIKEIYGISNYLWRLKDRQLELF